MHFTKRQKVLFGRLETLINRIATWPLPLTIREVWGFGSFFRQKENPRDLDLQLLYTGRTAEDETFAKVMDRLLHLTTTAATPLKSLAKIRSEIPSHLVTLIEKWVGLFSWSMLSTSLADVFVYSAEPLTRRLLKEGLPKLSLHLKNADRERDEETKHPVFFLWSREKPDLQANLQALSSDGRIRSALLQELANFARQLTCHRTMLQGCTTVFRSAWRERRSDFDPHDWFDKRMRWHGLRRDGWELDETSDDVPLHDRAWDSLSDQELRCLAESKRAELKEMMAKVTVARSAAWAACRFASERPPFAKKAWIALCAYWNVPRVQLSRQRVREALKTLGLPAERIEEECRFRKTTCFMRDDTGQLEIHESDLSRSFKQR